LLCPCDEIASSTEQALGPSNHISNLMAAAVVRRDANETKMRVDDRSIAALMARSQQGDADAHEAVLRFCMQWLTRYFGGKIHADQVQDLVQETLISIHTKRTSYDATRPFVPWLAAIARYRWIDRLRKTYRMEMSRPETEPAAIDPEDSIAASISIERMLQMLTRKQQAAIRLVKLQGYSVSEAAEKTGMSESNIKMNIMRGIRKLAALVEEE
jgi:RNA polymerase sigma factor (sigma-70 family)